MTPYHIQVIYYI